MNMKRIMVLLLSVSVLGLTACSGPENDAAESEAGFSSVAESTGSETMSEEGTAESKTVSDTSLQIKSQG